MPSFDTINNVYAPQQKLNHTEMLRAIKLGIASEFEAIQIYQQIMESTDNESVKIVLTDITNDEMHHAGQLTKLLEVLGPEDIGQYEHGFNQAIAQLGLARPGMAADNPKPVHAPDATGKDNGPMGSNTGPGK